MIEKVRIHISQIFSVLLVVIICLSENSWEYKAPFVTTVLFFFGAVLVGIASIGRLWCSIYIAGYKTKKLIAEGPYSMCRNPLYFFSFLGAIGVEGRGVEAVRDDNRIAVQGDEFAASLLAARGKVELSLGWVDEKTGLLCKARGDKLTRDPASWPCHIDLKSMRDVPTECFCPAVSVTVATTKKREFPSSCSRPTS